MRNSNFPFKIDFALLIPALVIVILSLTTVFSINSELFRNQLIFSILGIFAFILVSQVNYNVLKYYTVPFYILSIALLLIVFFFGEEIRGSTRWIEFMGFQIQFSEIIKPLLAVSLAGFLSAWGISLRSFAGAFLFSLPICGLIFLQPDFGNASIFLGVLGLTIFFIGYPFKYFLGLLGIFVAFLPLIWQLMRDYQKERLMTFLNFQRDPLGSSYNVIQSVIAVGSGKFLGKGLGQATQAGFYFLPEMHTDFIFATLSEELGFVGGLILIVAFIFLFYRIFRIISFSENTFCRTIALSGFILIFIQFFLNIGMNIGIVPVVGITLPFLSYGGSSMVSNFIFLGLISAVSIERRTKTVLEIK